MSEEQMSYGPTGLSGSNLEKMVITLDKELASLRIDFLTLKRDIQESNIIFKHKVENIVDHYADRLSALEEMMDI